MEGREGGREREIIHAVLSLAIFSHSLSLVCPQPLSQQFIPSPKDIKVLCADDEAMALSWTAGIRLAKYGLQIRDNYHRAKMTQFKLEDLATADGTQKAEVRVCFWSERESLKSCQYSKTCVLSNLSLPPSPRTVLASSLGTGLSATWRRFVSSTRNAEQRRRREGELTASLPHHTKGTMEALGELPISQSRISESMISLFSLCGLPVLVPHRRQTSLPSHHRSTCAMPHLRPTAPRSSSHAPLSSSRCPSTPTPPPHSQPRPQGMSKLCSMGSTSGPFQQCMTNLYIMYYD